MKEKLCWILGPGDRVMISGHQLHAALGCEMPYQEWFIRQLQCGYKSGEDFIFNEELNPVVSAYMRDGGVGTGDPFTFEVIDENTFKRCTARLCKRSGGSSTPEI